VPTFVTFPVATADQFTFNIHVPFVTILKSILVSHPVELIVGHVPVAAFVIVNSFTALGTEVVGNLMSSLLHPSLIWRYVAHSIVIHPSTNIESVVVFAKPTCPVKDGFHHMTHKSLSVSVLFCISLPVVESNLAIALSVAEAGQTTSPDQPHVLAIVTIPSALVPVVVRVIPLHSASFTLPPDAESVTVWLVASLVFAIV
jgi:hypothetical protein